MAKLGVLGWPQNAVDPDGVLALRWNDEEKATLLVAERRSSQRNRGKGPQEEEGGRGEENGGAPVGAPPGGVAERHEAVAVAGRAAGGRGGRRQRQAVRHILVVPGSGASNGVRARGNSQPGVGACGQLAPAAGTLPPTLHGLALWHRLPCSVESRQWQRCS
jgi:hypothetical protein